MNSMVAFLTDILTFKAISEADSCSCNAQLVQSLLVTAIVLAGETHKVSMSAIVALSDDFQYK